MDSPLAELFDAWVTQVHDMFPDRLPYQIREDLAVTHVRFGRKENVWCVGVYADGYRYWGYC